MMRIFRQILEDIKRGENIDLFITVTLVAIIAVLDVLSIASTGLVASVTLATLGLIALGLLVTRYKIENIYHTHDVVNTVKLSTKIFSSLDIDLANERTKEIWMLGLVLRGTIYRHFYDFNRNVAQGTRIRAMITNWNKVDMNTTVKRLSRGVTTERFRTGYEEAIDRLRIINQSVKDLDGVKLKLLEFVPSFSLYIFPKTEDGGIIYVEMYCFKSSDGSIPKFRVTERENPIWYKHFLSQFELMWQDAEEFPLKLE